MNSNAPVALFVYNRPDHTRRVVDALRRNRLAAETRLLVYSDGPKGNDDAGAVEEVRNVIRNAYGFRAVEMIEREKNLGLGRSIIAGVSEVISNFGEIIVLEDDLVVSPYFLEYMNKALRRFRTDERVASIHGYLFPLDNAPQQSFFLRYSGCWGWATWERAWDLLEPDSGVLCDRFTSAEQWRRFTFNHSYPFDEMLRLQARGLSESWAIRWQASLFLADKLTLHPPISLVQNIGFDGTGTHCSPSHWFEVKLAEKPVLLDPPRVEESHQGYRAFRAFYRRLKMKMMVHRVLHNFKKPLSWAGFRQ